MKSTPLKIHKETLSVLERKEKRKGKESFTLTIPKSAVTLWISSEKWEEVESHKRYIMRILPIVEDKKGGHHPVFQCGIHFYSNLGMSNPLDNQVWKELSELDTLHQPAEWYWCATKLSQYGAGVLTPLLLWDKIKVGNLSLKMRILSYLDENRPDYTPRHDLSAKPLIESLNMLINHYARLVELQYLYQG